MLDVSPATWMQQKQTYSLARIITTTKLIGCLAAQLAATPTDDGDTLYAASELVLATTDAILWDTGGGI